ncbi:hypothetical protein QBC38DRAFT_490882 [Podospora fimiseda]|uniref:Enoyl reductase (ER) domain-containing protein n=1 Tax=Podospora fimiseda TaxID=252190 RepID=A0AAN7BFB8_9PEZI|nr:hypothetical protein QBC38DRAFT_490882 [Podospora fimiseda]
MSSTNLPKTMRAMQWTTATPNLHSNLTLNPSAPVPPISPNQVLVKVLSAAINPADHKIPESIPAFLRRFLIGTGAITPGMDFCGRIVQVGSKVDKTKFSEGEKVFGRLGAPGQHGTLAEYVPVPANVMAKLPEGVSVDEAACLGIVGETTYQSIQPFVKEGDKVFINGGSGGTGTFSVQVAKALGCHVTTTCSTGKIDFVKSLGADEIIDYTKSDVIAELKKKGQVFSVVVDNVGTPYELYKASDDFLLPSGRYMQIGAPPSLATVLSIMKRTLLPGILGGGKRAYTMVYPKHQPWEMDVLAGWVKEGKLKVVFEEPRYKLEEAAKAFEKLREGRNRGKIVVKVAEE